MNEHQNGSIRWLSFPLLDDAGMHHGIFQRQGGSSRVPYDSLNTSFEVQDKALHVQSNVNRITELLGIDQCITMRQRHTRSVQSVTPQSNSIIDCCDGLITHHSRLGLLSLHADCQPALFFDPVEKVLANVHCGWRGNVLDIYSETVRNLCALGCKPANILVGIGPSLGPCHAEFINYKKELPIAFWDFQVKPNHFDLWAISRYQLETAGILPHHIHCANICTYSNAKNWYSYRRERTTGRNATLACLS